MLPFNTFKTVIENAPLISIDLIVYNQKGEVLLGKRNNRPAQGYWFVPGGSIQKDEPMAMAFRRLTLNELGAEFCISQADFIGHFEHFYADNVSTEKFSTHYIALGYKIVIDTSVLVLPVEQHNLYQWLDINSLLAHDSVHQHSKWYFNK